MDSLKALDNKVRSAAMNVLVFLYDHKISVSITLLVLLIVFHKFFLYLILGTVVLFISLYFIYKVITYLFAFSKGVIFFTIKALAVLSVFFIVIYIFSLI